MEAKSNEYRVYIEEHKRNVVRAYERIRATCRSVGWVDRAVARIDATDRIATHDDTKYSRAEFDAYRRRFYPVSPAERDAAGFAAAWRHHYTANDHHWEHWLVSGRPTDMSDEAIVEMVADWEAMSYLKGGSALRWLEQQGGRMHLTDATREKARVLAALLCR